MPERRMVYLKDVIHVIFQKLEPVRLMAMWDEDGKTEDIMIKIIYALYLIKD
jgi:hypothetical protein